MELSDFEVGWKDEKAAVLFKELRRELDRLLHLAENGAEKGKFEEA